MIIHIEYGDRRFNLERTAYGNWNIWRKLYRQVYPRGEDCRQLSLRSIYRLDYLRLAKNENIAKVMFQKKLNAAVNGENIIYVISEKEHLPLRPEGALRILVTADLELIKSRFAQRMRGNLPAPVAAMLEKKHGCFDAQPHNIHVVSGETDLDTVVEKIIAEV